MLHIPELRDEHSVLRARPGFNIIATANTGDCCVHEMSADLKRHFNSETVKHELNGQCEAGICQIPIRVTATFPE